MYGCNLTENNILKNGYSINAAVEQYILAEQYGEALCHLDNRVS